MNTDTSLEDLPRPLVGALTRRGFTSLTPIQQAVLEPAAAGRDLRLWSKTGSGKTVAIGIVLCRDLEEAPSIEATEAMEGVPDDQDDSRPRKRGAVPEAVVIAPTRELAAQLTRELSWLMRPSGRTCCKITGGESYPMQMRALRDMPSIVIGTPGRLRDHIERGFIDLSQVRSVVLDEADQMLDMGFREDLQAIVERAAPERRMHMASATFSREAQGFAEQYQSDARQVYGSKPGEINADIDHVAHLVRPDDRLSALVNVLLLAPQERCLVFVRTRADAADLALRLAEAGFSARPIHGDMEQAERTRTLDAFRSGILKVLVATDVAARGLDIPDVACVVHADPPGDAEALTHRSGRTGRAGNKGRSVMIVTPSARLSVLRMIDRSKISVNWSPAPTARDVLNAADERLVESVKVDMGEQQGDDTRLAGLAKRLVQEHEQDLVGLVQALLVRAGHAGPSAPREFEPLCVPERRPAFNSSSCRLADHVPFHINWGTRKGADARRLLAVICRRGQIRGNQVGAIRLGEHFCTFEVDASVAMQFAKRVKKLDPREPRLRIAPYKPVSRMKRCKPSRRERPTG